MPTDDAVYEVILQDRIDTIRDLIGEYGEDQFSVSFSGGKDSCVLSELIDEALPGNRIPRVFVNTGIEYKAVVDFVKERQKTDDRIEIVSPGVKIKTMLETLGYPFKSKEHSAFVNSYQKNHAHTHSTQRYMDRTDSYSCPKILRYQFEEGFDIPISAKCCDKLKKQPLHKWSRHNKKSWDITGIRRDEGGATLSRPMCGFCKTA